MWGFGKFADERRLAKALRQRPLDSAALETLRGAVAARIKELPGGLLWKMHVQARKAMEEVDEDSALWMSLYQIFRGSLGEIQNRCRAR